MTPQNYYARRRAWRRQEVDVQLVLELARAERAYQPRLGVRKLYYLIGVELKAAGVKMGRDRLFEELRKAGLLVERKPSAWPKTTHFNPALPVFKNLIKRCQVSGRNQVWVADITYIRTQDAFLYLGLITDKWSRKIVGYHLGETLETRSVLKALAMALGGLRQGAHPCLKVFVLDIFRGSLHLPRRARCLTSLRTMDRPASAGPAQPSFAWPLASATPPAR